MRTDQKTNKWRISAVVLASALAMAACGKKDGGHAQKPPMVSVMTV